MIERSPAVSENGPALLTLYVREWAPSGQGPLGGTVKGSPSLVHAYLHLIWYVFLFISSFGYVRRTFSSSVLFLPQLYR